LEAALEANPFKNQVPMLPGFLHLGIQGVAEERNPERSAEIFDGKRRFFGATYNPQQQTHSYPEQRSLHTRSHPSA